MNKITLLTAVTVLLASCGINSKIVCHYKFNNNLKDSSKNHWDLPLDSNITFETDRNGIENYAINIDSKPLPLKGDDSNYNLPLSFSFWINFKELNPSILGLGVSENIQTGIWFSLGKSSKTMNKLAINIGNGGRPSPKSRKTFISNLEISKNQWYYVVATINKKSEMTIYVDGKLQDGFYTGTATSFKFDSSNNYLGKVWKTDDLFKGSIDDFRIYSIELNEKQINKLKNNY